MNPRRAALVGLVFVAIAIFYWLFQYLSGATIDYAGITLLLALGGAMSLVAYTLVRGLAGDRS